MSDQSAQTPSGDPTAYTNDAIERAIEALRDYIDGVAQVLSTRLDAMDKAVDLKRESITDIHDWMETSVHNLERVMNEKFNTTTILFDERDKRFRQRDEDDKTAILAALNAQKELSNKQDEYTQKAIDKSERATTETISKNAQADEARARSLSDKIDDLKERVARGEAGRIGGREAVQEKRATTSAIYAAVGFGLSLLLGLITVVTVLVATSP